MFRVCCPCCGHRPASEFRLAGPAPLVEPIDPIGRDDEAWGEALFRRPQAGGLHYERWRHLGSCGRFFYALRDTVTGEFRRTFDIEMPLLLDAAE
jgi:sarcosine oxidase subunit delta